MTVWVTVRNAGKVILSKVNNKLILTKENKPMPIVEDKNGVHIEYTIPSNIKNLITDDFLNDFYINLFELLEYRRMILRMME